MALGLVPEKNLAPEKRGNLGQLGRTGRTGLARHFVGEKLLDRGSGGTRLLFISEVELPEHRNPDNDSRKSTERQKGQSRENDGARINGLRPQAQSMPQTRESAPRERIFRRNKADHAASDRAQPVPRLPGAPRPLF